MKYQLKELMLPAPRSGGFRMEGYWVWCGSVAKGEDGLYHMFASRWRKTLPMHPGWLLESEIVRAVSDKPEGPYHFKEVVLPARGPQYWDGRMTHNPHITRQGGKWVLYYTGSTHPFADLLPGERPGPEDPRVIVARANKRVGIAEADNIAGPWKRFSEPVLPVRPDCEDNLLTSNPAPCINKDGSVLLMYKSRAYKQPPYTGLLHGAMKLHTAKADRYMGPYLQRTREALFSEDAELEDPFIWQEDKGYYMIAKDMHGNICGEKYGGVYARSQDGQSWQLERGRLAYSRRVLWEDGKEELMGNMERPFILFEAGKPVCMFFAVSDGTDSFRDATDTWNMTVPLKNMEE